MFFYLLLIIMASRLYPLYTDEKISAFKLILMMGLQFLFLLIFSMSFPLVLLLIILFIVDILQFIAERYISRINIIRFASFLVLFLTALVFASKPVNLTFSNVLVPDIRNFIYNIDPFIKLNMTINQFIIILSGLFFLLNESNSLIRLIFEVSGKFPVTKETLEPDRKELNAGRIIGILERIIIFFFVTIGQFAAVGFVIAAKGVVRYKELEDRDFAEYVLIGTLLSSLLAVSTGFIVTRILI